MQLCMVMDINQTYCCEHSAVYTNIKSLCQTPETNMSYVSYILIKKKKRGKEKNLGHRVSQIWTVIQPRRRQEM